MRTVETVVRCDPTQPGPRSLANPLLSGALDGPGFFVISTRAGLRFTRRGDFVPGVDGFLYSHSGGKVQALDDAGQLVDLRFDRRPLAPRPTSRIRVVGILTPNSDLRTFDPAMPVATSNFNSSVRWYDSLGRHYDGAFFYNRTGTGSWEVRLLVEDGEGLLDGTKGAPLEVGSGTLTFDSRGDLDTQTSTVSFEPMDALQPQPLEFDFGDTMASGGTGRLGLIQVGLRSETSEVEQDGYSVGLLEQVGFTEDGTLEARYSNGQRAPMGHLALATFERPGALVASPDMLLMPTRASGEPQFGRAGEPLFPRLLPGFIETPCVP